MGYTHYFSTKVWDEEDEAGWQRALPIVRKILKRHGDVLCFEYDRPARKPCIGARRIQFNGKGDDGHETFIAEAGEQNAFCKTARKPYDQAVCEVLLVLHALIPHFRLDSDGFAAELPEDENQVEADGTWPEAVAAVEQYGIRYHVQIGNRRAPYCDLTLVLA